MEAHVGGRNAVVHCFNYEWNLGVVIGVNPANARSRLGPKRDWIPGPEYLVVLEGQGSNVSGRTRDRRVALRAVKLWLTGSTVELVSRRFAFVDEGPRLLRAAIAGLDEQVRVDIVPDPAEMWLVRGDRACKVTISGGTAGCAFLLGQAHVGYTPLMRLSSVHAWLVDRCAVVALPVIDPVILLEAHVEHIEHDPARWHWLNMFDRIRDPNDVLVRLAPLVERLGESPIASRYYCYSSMASLCFSASSHYPWVDTPCGRIDASADGAIAIGDSVLTLMEALAYVERALTAGPTPPFFGSADTMQLEALQADLRRRGSAVTPVLELRRGWYRIVAEAGRRRIEVGARVTFFEGERAIGEGIVEPEDLAAVFDAFLVEEVTLDRLAPLLGRIG